FDRAHGAGLLDRRDDGAEILARDLVDPLGADRGLDPLAEPAQIVHLAAPAELAGRHELTDPLRDGILHERVGGGLGLGPRLLQRGDDVDALELVASIDAPEPQGLPPRAPRSARAPG